MESKTSHTLCNVEITVVEMSGIRSHICYIFVNYPCSWDISSYDNSTNIS